MTPLRTGHLCLICAIAFIMGCGKNSDLNDKPNSEIQIPSTLRDLQGLLDDDYVLNISPNLGDLLADNYYLRDSFLTGLSPKEMNAYIWSPELFKGQTNIFDWNGPYEQVLYTNVALKTLNTIKQDSSNHFWWQTFKGTAHFLRANAYYNLSQLFIKPYDSLIAETALGLPIRQTDNVLEFPRRSTMQQTYDQIISDLNMATEFLPVDFDNNFPNRPSKAAVWALLSKVYLCMRKYDTAGVYANNCLQLNNTLLDYNTLDNNQLLPFGNKNPEILFYSKISIDNTQVFLPNGAIIDSVLYRSYDANDLRLTLFYRRKNQGLPYIKSGYSGITPFSGLATDEIYLIRAECLARQGHINEAMADVNILLKNRYKLGTFTPLTAFSADQALMLILAERRKELPFRNVRWTDLRRLNAEGYNITLTRKISGQTYNLAPNSSKYTLPIPPDVITLSGIQQNPD